MVRVVQANPLISTEHLFRRIMLRKVFNIRNFSLSKTPRKEAVSIDHVAWLLPHKNLECLKRNNILPRAWAGKNHLHQAA